MTTEHSELRDARERVVRRCLTSVGQFDTSDLTLLVTSHVRGANLLDGGILVAAIARATPAESRRIRHVLGGEMSRELSWTTGPDARLQLLTDAGQRRPSDSAQWRSLARWTAAERLLRRLDCSQHPPLLEWSRLGADLLEDALSSPAGLGMASVAGAVRFAELAARSTGRLETFAKSLQQLTDDSASAPCWWCPLVSNTYDLVQAELVTRGSPS